MLIRYSPYFECRHVGLFGTGDARACKKGVECLNEQLLQGPDRNNALRAVILRARKGPYAFTADVENMFHQIAVPEHQHTYLRFFWYQDNDSDKPLIEYISRVHLMGKTSSPAVANLAVRYAARSQPPESGEQWIEEDDLLDIYQLHRKRDPDEVEKSLTKQFYVDDYVAAATEQQALDMVEEAIRRFQRYSMKLCKVTRFRGGSKNAHFSILKLHKLNLLRSR